MAPGVKFFNNTVVDLSESKMFYSKLKEFETFCYTQHDVVCNQKYAGKFPYSAHLKWVKDQADKFIKLVPQEDRNFVYAGCAGHDLIEDARVTYNDLKQLIGVEVADIIYACTEERGRNRLERHSQAYYELLGNNELAIFVKVCDIIANVTFSILENSTMIEKYRNEHETNMTFLYDEKYDPMFKHLGKLLAL